MTPGSCPGGGSQKNLNDQVDMFGFGDFDDQDYFSLNTPAGGSDLL